MKEEIASAAMRASPAVAVVGSDVFFGLTLDGWVKIATLLYLMLQAFFLLRSELRKRGRK